MSNNVKRRPNPSPLAARELPPRRSRHGRVIVGTPEGSREDQRPSPYVKTWREVKMNPEGKVEVVFHNRPMTEQEVQVERNKVMRATKSTNTYGKPNTGGKEKK